MRRLLVLVAAFLVAPAAAIAQQSPLCGATITESITLSGDLFCSGTALILGTRWTEDLDPYITVDLNGFTVSSEFAEPCAGRCATIEMGFDSGNQGVRLRNGRVSRTGVSGYTIDYSWGGRQFDNLLIDGGQLHCHQGGLSIDNSRFAGTGIRTDYCFVLVENNTFTGDDKAIDIVNNFFGTRVVGNSIAGGGISMQFGVRQTGDEVTGNQVRMSPRDGIVINYQLDYDFQRVAEPTTVPVRDNVVVDSGRAGIRVLNTSSSVLTLSSNVVLNNTELGIDAPGAIDGGDNRAGGNGNPLQCVGVVCIPDLDGDGIPDESDNCAATPNADQLDTDNDGLGDPCDPAPLDPDSADAQCKVNYLAASQSLAMCTANLTGATTALGVCNYVVIGTNGDFNGDGKADIVDNAIFRRWLAGYPVP